MNNKNEFFYCTHGLTSGKVKQSINICIHNYIYISVYIYIYIYCFLDSSVDKEFSCNTGDLCLIPGLGRSPGEGKGYPPWNCTYISNHLFTRQWYFSNGK